ncbi:MAG: hypothetical protein WCK42_05655, partial [Myxococcaceae bacterium]
MHLSTQESLSPEAAKLFSLDTVDSTTFTGKEIITIANTAVSILPAADSELFRFHLTAALQQANTNSAEGHWRSALNNRVLSKPGDLTLNPSPATGEGLRNQISRSLFPSPLGGEGSGVRFSRSSGGFERALI